MSGDTYRVIRSIARPDPALVQELAAFAVATVHEANDRRDLLAHEIRPLGLGQRLCGPALTVLTTAADNLMVHAAVDAAQPGDVLVLASTSPTTHGMVGELLVTQAIAHGITGMILDSGVRDTAVIRDLGFPVWSRAVSAAGTSKTNPGWVNIPVVCGGVTIRPGDVVVADDDGVAIVPADRLTTVIEIARRREAAELRLRERYAAGESSLDVHGLRAVIADLGVKDEGPRDD